MALLTKKVITDRETASYKLDRATVELIRLYSEFIGSPQEHVVNEALGYIFRKDKEFKTWLNSSGKAELLTAAEHVTPRGKRASRVMAVPAPNGNKSLK